MADPPPPPDAPTNGSAAIAAISAAEALVPCPSKRQRRPSVRLGDPGEQPAAAIPSFDSLSRRPKPHPHLHWRPLPSSKTRPLTHIRPPDDPPLPSSSSDARAALSPVDENLEPLAAALRRGAKPKKPAGVAKRVRSSWASKVEEPTDVDHKTGGSGEEGLRDYSTSPSNHGYPDPAAGEDAPSETDGGGGHNWANNNDNNDDHSGRCRSTEDGGVRSWLRRLGLSRYAPVFEIHEVDDEVLPMLTLEDLKDMGITAVGSRRKMYCAIQNLRKSMS